MTILTVETAMLRRLSIAVRAAAPVLALAMTACSAPSVEPPETLDVVVTAAFDPTTSQIPLPNDLAFFAAANAGCATGDKNAAAPACIQADLLASFSDFGAANMAPLVGAFPNDQEVAITIDFVQSNFDKSTHVFSQTAPDLDLSTFTSTNFFAVRTTASGSVEVALDPLKASDYVPAADGTHGTLTIHNQGHAPWLPGAYSVVLRGGPSGVKTKTNQPVYPSLVFDLLAQDVDLSDVNNLGLLRAQLGSVEAAVAQAKQLEIVRQLYRASAFPVADKKFPHQELAIATTFKIAPVVTNVVIDAASGQVPLPIDLLRDPATGKLSAVAACTLAGSTLDSNGNCLSPAAAGFRALDGFSTTAAMIAQTSDLIRASSVTKDTVLLYDLTDKNNPVQVDPSTLIFEPCEFTQGCNLPTALSPAIALQPAGATAGDPTSVFRTKPLKDNTDYAVVITTGVLDKAGAPLGSETPAKLLKFSNPLLAGGKATVPGLDVPTATLLEGMRSKLKPLLDKLSTTGIPRGRVAMAYTFHTQTILSQAVQLAALPYTTPAATALPGPVFAATPAAAFTEFGVVNTIPSSNIDEVLEADITTFDLIDPLTGAFNPDPTKAVATPIHVLIATPKVTNANVPACAGALQPFGKCAPMMIFRHGLGGGRAQMLLIADTYAAAGMVTVAIDAAMHGDRSLCVSGTSGSASGCAGGAACTTTLPAGAQGDVHPPGTCGAAGFVLNPVTPGATGNTDGIPAISGSFPYLLSANFFRTRDTFRQDLIDESQLVRALAFVPSGNPPTGHSVFDHMVARGVIIDPATIYFSGQSLGAIHGTMDVATNPRISKAVLNVGGGTLTDIFTNSPAFTAQVDALLAQVGITRGTPQFLQFLIVAKTVLDPADPVNFAGHLTAKTLPNLLPPLGGNPNGTVPQAPKKILTQMANCDGVVPNPFGLVWASNVPTGPLPTGAAFFAPGATGTFELFVGAGFNPADFGNPAKCSQGPVSHGFLLDFTNPTLTLAGQTDAANFVMKNTLPPSLQHP
jgi:hypothetical protein